SPQRMPEAGSGTPAMLYTDPKSALVVFQWQNSPIFGCVSVLPWNAQMMSSEKTYANFDSSLHPGLGSGQPDCPSAGSSSDKINTNRSGSKSIQFRRECGYG
ncbi:hypothetical protein AAII07_59840, partial [Microvirga sp. 0TCS3.31]